MTGTSRCQIQSFIEKVSVDNKKDLRKSIQDEGTGGSAEQRHRERHGIKCVKNSEEAQLTGEEGAR